MVVDAQLDAGRRRLDGAGTHDLLRTDQPDTFVTPWGREATLTEDQKRERAREATHKRIEETKRTVEEAKPASRKVSIVTDNPARVEKAIAEVREVWARQDVRAQIREAAGRLS